MYIYIYFNIYLLFLTNMILVLLIILKYIYKTNNYD